MSLTHRRACRAHTTGSPQKDDQANREAECGQQTSADHPNIVHSDKADHRTRSTCQGGRQKHESNHSRDLNHPRKPNHSNDFTHPNYSNQRNDSHLYNSNQPNDSNPSTNLSYPNRSSLFKSRCLAGYLALICVHLAQAAPLSSNPSNLINLNDHVNPNPLNQFLKEPDLVKVYKDRVVFHIFPLAKKDVEISWYYVIVELVDDQLTDQLNLSFNNTNLNEIDFSLNYFSSLKKGLPFFAAVKLHDSVFTNRHYVTVIVGKHHFSVTKPREFRLTDYVNPLLTCGKEYRFAVAAELKAKRSGAKKEFVYVPYSRTIIMNEENGTCDAFSIDTYALFLVLSAIALIVSLLAFCILLTVNCLSTGTLCFWKRKKMNCQQLLRDGSNQKERLTLINHTNIYESSDYKGDYDQISIGKSKAKGLDKSSPVAIADLLAYYNRMNSEHLFRKEFESVPKGKLNNWKIATLKINQKKNRYFGLLPYDYNRVVLRPFPNERDFIESEKFNDKKLTKDQLNYVHYRPTDYINASYIDVLDGQGGLVSKRYIATQGPLESTINDFWKMVYQTNCHQIVMVANVVESGEIKVEKYWPDAKTTKRYGKLRCTCKAERVYADYTIRLFRIELEDPLENGYVNSDDLANNNVNNDRANPHLDGADLGREVVQYHFTNWIDHGVPEYSDSVALLLSSVHSHWSYQRQSGQDGGELSADDKLSDNRSAVSETNLDEELFEMKTKNDRLTPIVVHCSAGIGRSGVFCLVDSMLEQANRLREQGEFDTGQLDILKQFANLRKQRVHCVEQVSQYAFVHQVLVEMLCSADVRDVLPQHYDEYYRMLRESSTKSNDFRNISKLDEQFGILNKFRVRLDDGQTSVGMFHLKKNRNRQSIPKNSARVLLPVVDSDYINAVNVNGFKYANEFIVTEVPLREMRYQFWQMVNSEQIDTIVCLNSVESQHVYWPTELNNPLVFRELEIELMCEEKTTDYYVKRQFRINKKKTIFQMHYKGWDLISQRPSNSASFCLYMKAVQTHLNRYSLHPNRFVVQCQNGVTASGIYCTTKHICDRLFAENLINIFLSAKYVRTNRMQFIESLEQYNFLYEFLQLITKSFFSKDYQNLCFSMTDN